MLTVYEILFPYEKIKITSARIEGEESNNQESIEKAPKE